ncbi:MAG TPA: ammonia-forming cytochrome c nitrite reductase subunit c552 [Candidatus Deferrimicrobium sp.]|nr:ammonia-forming cytochrome c nitrite reductase subunit c552 [Candidatus Deferrimicrobium sp.]
MKYKALTGLILVGLVLLGGCAKNQQTFTQTFAVAPGKLTEVKKEVQPKLDVYVPLRDQYAASKHAKALEDLNKSDHAQDYCYNCHSSEYRLAPQDAKPNVKQLSTSITCIVCHDLDNSDFRLRTTPLETCTNCHTAAVEIKPGIAVQHPQKEMLMGKGALEVPEMPSNKYKTGLTCIECHMPNQSHTFEALTPQKALDQKVGSTCMMCHTKLTQKEFADKVAELQNDIDSNTKQLKKSLEELKVTLDTAKSAGRDVSEAQKLYDVAVTNESFVENDGSKGIHNFEYSKATLDVVQKKITATMQALK